MKYIVWSNVRLILMIGVVIFLYSFTSIRNSNRKLIKSEVVFVGKSKNFLKHETVNKLLIENNSNVKTIAKLGVDLKKLENSINKQEMVKSSQVFVSVDGVLNAEVIQKTPIARVENGLSSFYIDNEGSKMSISELFTARVMLISGKIDNKNRKKIAMLVNKINNDEFMKKNIIGMQVLNNDDIILANRNYDFQIEFGKVMNVEDKILKYKAFFQKANQDDVLKKYKKINLKFSHQVVCTK